jgi:hypothetical protein
LACGKPQRIAVSDTERPHVLSATQVRAVEVIDGGGTLAVRFYTADGGEACVLLPIGVVGDLLGQLADALDIGPDRASQPAG